MKRMLLPMLGLILLAGCEKEQIRTQEPTSDQEIEFRSATKVRVCHYTGSEQEPWQIIEISDKAWANAHKEHGDAVDFDGDGYFNIDNACGPTDCDDSDPNLNEVCCSSSDITQMDYNGTLYVEPTCTPGYDQPRTWQEAFDYCKELEVDGFVDWYLPSLAESNALFFNQNTVGGGFNTSSSNGGTLYWTTTEYNGSQARAQNFYNGGYFLTDIQESHYCRCVHR